jgi:hypothetical protein
MRSIKTGNKLSCPINGSVLFDRLRDYQISENPRFVELDGCKYMYTGRKLQTCRWMNGLIDEWMDWWVMDRWMVAWMDGLMDGRMYSWWMDDTYINAHTHVHIRYICVRTVYLSVGIATGYWLDDWEVGVRVPVGSRILTSPCFPYRLWGPPNLLYNGYRG